MDNDNNIDDLFDSTSLLSALEEVQSEHSEIDSLEISLDEELSDQKNEFPDKSNSVEDLLKDVKQIINDNDVIEKVFIPQKIEDYDVNTYSQLQLQEIEKGIKHNIDVRIYDSPELSGRQMRQIRYGLERGLDISFYAKKYLRDTQMLEIRRGLQDKLNVESYARIVLSPSDMRKKRQELFYEKYGDRDYSNISYEYFDKDTGIKIYVDPGLMEAGIILSKRLESNFTKFDLKNLMKAYDITEGFVENELPQNLSNLPTNVKIPVMRGIQAVDGKDGYFEYLVPIEETKGPRVNEDGTVNLYAMSDSISIKAGDTLIRYHEACAGQDGITVNGFAIRGKYGEDLPLIENENLEYNKEKKEYISKKSGFIRLKEGNITIMENLVLERDVTGNEGSISFDGSIIINGNVTDSAELYATGDIIVNGFVEAAKFNSGGDIVISGGVNGDDRGSIIAKRNVTASFLENVNVDAGGTVEVGYILNSNITSGDFVKTEGKKSLICGGNIVAAKGIETSIIGSRNEARTYIEVGGKDDAYEEYMKYDSEKCKIQGEAAKVQEAINTLIKKLGPMAARSHPTYEKLEAVLENCNMQIHDFQDKMEELNQKRLENMNLFVVASREAFKNTLIVINGNRLLLKEDAKSPIFKCEGRSIIIANAP